MRFLGMPTAAATASKKAYNLDACTSMKILCREHLPLYETWITDDRPCVSCAEEGVFSERLINLLTISDMDPAHEKYGKSVRISHSARLKEVSSVRPFHIHKGLNIGGFLPKIQGGPEVFCDTNKYCGADLMKL